MKFLQQGSTFTIGDVTNSHDRLPVGNYVLLLSMSGFYLQRKEPFQLPSKIYGNFDDIKRWIKSYNENTEKNLGIMLTGLKGTGKTIHLEKLCIDLQKPVILIPAGYHGPDFVNFLTNPLFEDCIVAIDEFEKVYPRGKEDHQTDLLKLMDGTFPTKLLFVLTLNEFNVSDYLVNRLGRVKYRKDFRSLDEDVINEVIDDMLDNKDHKESVLEFFDQIGICTYDLLVNVINEMNLFKEDALECGKYLNLKAEESWFEVQEILKDGTLLECESMKYSPTWKNFQINRNDKGFRHLHSKWLEGRLPLLKQKPEGLRADELDDFDEEENNPELAKYDEENPCPQWSVFINLEEMVKTKISPSVFELKNEETGVTYRFKRSYTRAMVF